jgi:hypothetical protein
MRKQKLVIEDDMDPSVTRAYLITKKIMDRNYLGQTMKNACIYWTRASHLATGNSGEVVLPQAGSAFWPRVANPRDDDNGLFGYRWEGLGSSAVQSSLFQGHLPEMHAWIYIPKTKLVIDFTSGFQAHQCRNLLGLHWEKSVRLPRAFCMHRDRLAENDIVYEPDDAATQLMLDVWKVCPWGLPVSDDMISLAR